MLDTVESYRKALDGFEQLAAVCEVCYCMHLCA